MDRAANPTLDLTVLPRITRKKPIENPIPSRPSHLLHFPGLLRCNPLKNNYAHIRQDYGNPGFPLTQTRVGMFFAAA
jgi:hypothetical protein